MNRLYLLALGLVFILNSCVHDALEQSKLDQELEAIIKYASPNNDKFYYKLPTSSDLSAIPQDPKNPLTKEKVLLGSFLFYETGMGIVPKNEQGMQTYSCSSCHIPSADFKSGRKQGIGEGGFGFGLSGESRVKNNEYAEDDMDVQGIRPLNVLNVAFAAENTLWNGAFGSGGANIGTEDAWGVVDPLTEINHLGYQGLETQNIEGLNIHRMKMTKELAEELGYVELFEKAFPDFSDEDRYSNLGVSLAISAYLRTLTTTEAPFQKWLDGDMNAMNDQQKRGAILFFEDANCTACHSSPAFNATKFYALGVNDLNMQVSFQENDITKKKNLGRGGFTGRDQDMYKFKVPTLYNLQGTPFYFHGSSKRSLKEVIQYFNLAIPENPNVPLEQIANDFKPLNLSEKEVDDLTAFIQFALQDETVQKFMPTSLPSGNCYPNADWKSRRELGCE